MLATNGIIVLTIVFFWFLLTFFDPGWGHYAFYIWSAMSGFIAVAQAWTFVNEIFNPNEGERLFGLLTAGGTLGGAAAGFGTKWMVERSFETNHLLWFVAALFLAASALIFWTDRRLRGKYVRHDVQLSETPDDENVSSIGAVVGGSRYLKAIALMILVSVIVSTLIDFQFKSAAKQAYVSKESLAGFFSSYYGWLSIATFFTQSVLTGKILSTFGLFPSLYLMPGVLLAGTMSILIRPSLFAAAVTRVADATLRNSIHRSGVEILYMPLSLRVKKRVKTFLDVVIERTGDATAGFIILLFSLLSADFYITKVHLICVALIFVWMLLIALLWIDHSRAPRKRITSQDMLRDTVGPRLPERNDIRNFK